jgi:elongation factor P
MTMIPTNQFTNGITLRVNGELYDLIFFEFVKPGKGAAFVRTKLRSLKTSGTKEMTFDSKDKVEQVTVDKKDMEFLFREGDNWIFMDPETFDQVPVGKDLMEPLLGYLKPNTLCSFKVAEEKVLAVALPQHMTFQVVETTPWVKGSTAAGGNKPAKIDTGTIVQVPVYLGQGEWIRVHTETGEFVDRAKAPEE